MDLLQRNINYLKENRKELFNRINDESLNLSNYHIEPLIDNLSNIVYNNEKDIVEMYDKSTIVNEIEQMVDRVKDSRTIIFYGLGLGYHIFEMIKLKNIRKVIIIEPDIKNLIIFMSLYDLKEFSNSLKIDLIICKDEKDICSYLELNHETIFYDNIQVESFNYYEKIYKQDYKRFLERFIIEYSGHVFSRNTALVKKEQFIRNGLYNYINYIEESYLLSSLFDRYENIPGIIVGAGPSLNSQLEILKGVEDKALIFAVGSGMNVLDKNDIRHHFKVAIDADSGGGNATYFKELKDKSVDLIYMPSLNNEALKDYEGNKFYSKAKVQTEYNYVENFLNIESMPIEGGGTVSMLTVDIAKKLGCNPIILLGQDLSYKDTNNYAKGAINQKNISKNDKNIIVKKDIYGNQVLTEDGLYSLKIAFDDFVDRHVSNWQTKIYNCTDGGLGIEGIENVKLEDILNKYCKDTIEGIGEHRDNSLKKIKIDCGKNDIWIKLAQNILEVEQIVQSVLNIINNMEELLKEGQNDIKLNEYNEDLKTKLKTLDDYEVFYEWIVPITKQRLSLVDAIYEKEYALEEDIWEQQKQLVMMMKMQYVEIEYMCKYILKVFEAIFKEKNIIFKCESKNREDDKCEI